MHFPAVTLGSRVRPKLRKLGVSCLGTDIIDTDTPVPVWEGRKKEHELLMLIAVHCNQRHFSHQIVGGLVMD